MSKPKTIHTVESLLARSTEEGECHLWDGYSTNKTPMVHQDGKMRAVRRVLLDLLGVEVRGKYLATSCGNPLCINPEHISQRTEKMHVMRMAKNAHKGAAAVRHQIGVLKWRRANPLKINEEIAAAIRADDRHPVEVAQHYGVSKSLVFKIRRGDMWRDNSNPFIALAQRAAL